MNFSEICNKTAEETVVYDVVEDYKLDPLHHNYNETYEKFFQFDTPMKAGLIAFNVISIPLSIIGHIVISM